MDSRARWSCKPGRTLRERKTILVVERFDLVRRLTLEILETQGYHVLTASEAARAIQLSHDHKGPFDLLLIDMMTLFASELSQWSALTRSSVKKLYMSGYSIEGPGVPVLLPCLHKPFTPQELIARVDDIVFSPSQSSHGSGSLHMAGRGSFLLRRMSD